MKKILCALFVLFCSYAFAEEATCPLHSEHHKDVDKRGDQVMGFGHEQTVHHFKLEKDGGIIVAEVKDSNDQASIGNIRRHFQDVVTQFANGDFSMPEKIHGRVPPGIPQMIQYKDQISYKFIETEKGGEVRIQTANSEAVHAIHQFLQFQIQDHRTGDSMECPDHGKHAENGATCPHHDSKE